MWSREFTTFPERASKSKSDGVLIRINLNQCKLLFKGDIGES